MAFIYRYLPQEIIDLIIDAVAELNSDSTSSLCSCSLVSKSFSYRSRYNLFGDIFISAEENDMLVILQSFLEILDSKQPVAGRPLLSSIKCFEFELRTGELVGACHKKFWNKKMNRSVNYRCIL